MKLDWLKRRRGDDARPRRPKLAGEPIPILHGPKVVIQRLERDSRAGDAIAALSTLYEVTDVRGDGERFEVLLGDCSYPDEAVVRLASELDEIDRDWQLYLSWPRSLDS